MKNYYKKICFFLIFFTTLLGISTVQAATCTNHKYTVLVKTIKQATCVTSGSAQYKCSSCSKTTTKTIPKFSHDYSKRLNVITESTCKKQGTARYKCSRCSAITTKNIAKKSHNYNKFVKTLKVATCKNNGSAQYQCATCTEKIQKTISKTAHSYTIKDKVVKTATCISTGVTRYKCSTKGCTSTSDKKTAKTNHEFTQLLQIVKESTCTNKGVWRYKCSNCNQTKDISVDKVKHNYTKMIEKKSEPTCTKNGIRIYQCTTCNSTIEKSDGKLGHKYILKTKDQNEHHKVCARCNNTTGIQKHTLMNGKCVCGYPKYEPYSDESNKTLQEHMKEKGYYNSEIDGKIGNGTRNAILRILKENNFDTTILPNDFGWEDITPEMYYVIMNHTDKAKNLISYGLTGEDTNSWAQSIMYYGDEKLKMENGKFVNPEVIKPKYVIIYLHGDCVGGLIGTHPWGNVYAFSYDTLLICPFSYTTSPFVNQSEVESLIMNVAATYPNAIIILEGHSSSTATVRNIAKDPNSEAAKHIDGYALYSPVVDVSGLNSEENCYVAFGKYEIEVSEDLKGTFYSNSDNNNVVTTGTETFANTHGSAPQFFGSQSHTEWLENIAENTNN